MKWTLLLLVLVSCTKEHIVEIEDVEKPTKVFNSEIENSIWVLTEIEQESGVSTHRDTLRFFKDSILVYNEDTTRFEFYLRSQQERELRIRNTPVGFVDCTLDESNLINGKLHKHPFYNVYVLTNRYKITMNRIK
jgi:hypothetical protein